MIVKPEVRRVREALRERTWLMGLADWGVSASGSERIVMEIATRARIAAMVK